jgi:hypothetical protein
VRGVGDLIYFHLPQWYLVFGINALQRAVQRPATQRRRELLSVAIPFPCRVISFEPRQPLRVQPSQLRILATPEVP